MKVGAEVSSFPRTYLPYSCIKQFLVPLSVELTIKTYGESVVIIHL